MSARNEPREIYEQYPGPHILYAAKIPPRPNLFDEVDFGTPLTADNAFLARRFWQEPDNHLKRAWENHQDRPYTRANDDPELDMHVLAHNVYEHLMSSPFIPISREDAEANWVNEHLNEVYNGIQGLDSLRELVYVSGRNVQDGTQWTQAKLKLELESRGLPAGGRKAEQQERLWRFEVDQLVGVLKQSNLNHWGISRTGPILSPATNTRLTALDMYTTAIWLNPYNPTYWTSRAYCHYMQGFFDLAIGDAYRSELLCEVLTTSTQRNRRPGFYTRVWDAVQMHMMAGCKIQKIPATPEVIRMRKANGINYFIPTLLNANHNIISLSLAAMNCWDDFDLQMEQHKRRNLQFRDIEVPKKRMMVVESIIKEMSERREKPTTEHPPLYGHEWMQGWVSGAPRYPYQQADVNREADRFVAEVNTNVFTISNHAIMTPNLCEVRPLGAKDGASNGLGVFARAAIKKGTLIHYEEPVIRGHLHPNILEQDTTRLEADNPRCDNCKAPINRSHVTHIQANWGYIKGTVPNPNGVNHSLTCWCLNMIHGRPWGIRNDMISPLYCPNNHLRGPGIARSCRDIAEQIFAPDQFKDVDWNWLQDSMRAPINEWQGQDYYVAHHEKQGTFLSLLFKNVIEITLRRREEDPNLLPHEINELVMLESGTDTDEPWRDSWFPFTMSGNIRVPFDILSSLGVDIFREFSFDTWALQLVLRKLLINAVVWDPARRGKGAMFTKTDGLKTEPIPPLQKQMLARKENFASINPSISDLYLFPGLSMFNHACRRKENATWGYSNTEVQNRVLVYAAKDIKADEEIRIPYQDQYLPGRLPNRLERQALTLFGKNCNCDQCTATGSGTKSYKVGKYVKETMAQKLARYAAASGSGGGSGYRRGAGGGAAGAAGPGGDGGGGAFGAGAVGAAGAAGGPGKGGGGAFGAGPVAGPGGGGPRRFTRPPPIKAGGFGGDAAADEADDDAGESKVVIIRPQVPRASQNPPYDENLAELVAEVYKNYPQFQNKRSWEATASTPRSQRETATTEDDDGDVGMKDAS